MGKTKKSGNKAPKSTAEEIEDDDEVDETEELDDDDEAVEDDEADEAPAKGKGKAEEVEFGASDLAKHLSKITGKTISPRELRAFIRKMAREDKPRVDREVVAGNRSRYNWPGGLKNAEVKAIIKAVEAGELQESKNAALQKLKEDKAAKKAAAGDAPAKKKGKKGKKAKVVEPDDDDEVDEVDDDDIEIDEDED